MKAQSNRRMTPDVIQRIRQLYEQGVTNQQLAARFGVSPAVISNVVHRRSHYAEK